MSLSEFLVKKREEYKIERSELAKRLNVPEEFIAYIEGDASSLNSLYKIFADAMGISVDQLLDRVVEPKDVSYEEKVDIIAKDAKFPNIRKALLSSEVCENPQDLLIIINGSGFSLAEKNMILFISTAALYEFCDSNSSGFDFDRYLFKLHAPLLDKFAKELSVAQIPDEEKAERLAVARSDIFACDKIENIAIRVLGSFATELESKLAGGSNFEELLEQPLKFFVDKDLMKISVKDNYGNVIDTISLLDVKKKKV